MSYDIWVELDPCAHCGRGVESRGDWNYTSNMGPAWREAGADLAEYHDKRAEECVPSLRLAIERMEAETDAYARKHNAPNGWGSMTTLIPALRRLLALFEENPGGLVKVSL